MSLLYLRIRAVFQDAFFFFIPKSVPDFVVERGVLFIHVPKAAGMSITTSLYKKEIGHLKNKNYQKNSIKTLSVVRNPYDRLVSAYFFLKQGGMNKYKADGVMSDYINNNFKDFDSFVRFYISHERFGEYPHFLSQVSFLKNRKGKIDIDYIAKLESLESDINEFCNKYNENIELMHINMSERKSYDEYYTEELKEIVYEKYKEDFELLGYSK